ncbi:hypothetical protein [Cryobacterium sp. Sr39]|uniref:hypothetical protein n=1 Tax=Cryobacterium suzukii TaxID=1259198 RepID=UPI0015840BD6
MSVRDVAVVSNMTSTVAAPAVIVPRSPATWLQAGTATEVLMLTQKQPGDQEPADDEKDINAREAAGRPRPQVIEADAHDGEGPQALDVSSDVPRLSGHLARDRARGPDLSIGRQNSPGCPSEMGGGARG